MKNDIIRDYLFYKHILIRKNKNRVSAKIAVKYNLIAAQSYGIKFSKGADLIDASIMQFLEKKLSPKVPLPFYIGFPQSVKDLPIDYQVLDRLVHYATTYGLGKFNKPGHSIFESEYKRAIFEEDFNYTDFIIVTEEEGKQIAIQTTLNLLSDSREISNDALDFCKTVIEKYNVQITNIASKSNTIKLLYLTKDFNYLKCIQLSDIYKLVNHIIVNYNLYIDYNLFCWWDILKKTKKNKKENQSIIDLSLKHHKINCYSLRNVDRKFIISIINKLIEQKKTNYTTCYEKRRFWVALFHHLHYKSTDEQMTEFINNIRNGKNYSFNSYFEALVKDNKVREATDYILDKKGTGFFLRNIKYILSRATNDDDIDYVINKISTKNNLILLSILKLVGIPKGKRTFNFTDGGLLKNHTETDKEYEKAKTNLPRRTINRVSTKIKTALKQNLKNKLNKVYIDDNMNKIRVNPTDTNLTGLGVLTSGSRIALPESKIIRPFIYWEKVNDVDLGLVGISENGDIIQIFNWHSIERNVEMIAFSGDQTSGYNGGSEYFDINTELLKEKFPTMRYLITTANVYSSRPFSRFICSAGYMVRDKISSGEVFEPKTVKTSFTIDCESTVAIPFAIDLSTNEMVWLNIKQSSFAIDAYNNSYVFIANILQNKYDFSVKTLFTYCAKKIVETPEEADIVVSDEVFENLNENQKQVHSYDLDYIRSLLF
ncbi:MAG: hypothetical protein K5765_04785 [Clostridia bacterium]|nr:hypothetical protein [Clostridia bacterium]